MVTIIFTVIDGILYLFQFINLIYNLRMRIRTKYLAKNKNILYINTNRKTLDESKILRQINGGIIALLVIDREKEFEKHFKKMKKVQPALQRRRFNAPIYYAGFASVPYAILDGHVLGDVGKVNFLEYDRSSDDYKVIVSGIQQSNRIIVKKPKDKRTKEVALIFSLSDKINLSAVKEKIGITDKIIISDSESDSENYSFSNEYLENLLSIVKQLMREIRLVGYTKVHIFSASRQSQSFIIGQAINKHDIDTYAYEFLQGKYEWKIHIQREMLEL